MAYRFLDLLESEYKEDTTSIKDQLKTRYNKTHDILKEAFSGEYVSKEYALERIQKDFLNENITPKSIDVAWLRSNMDYVVSTLKSLDEGDIKIIINNGDSGKSSAIGYELEGKKRPGRPAASAAVVAPVTAVAPTTVPGTDKTTQEPLVENPPECKCNCQKQTEASCADIKTEDDTQLGIKDGLNKEKVKEIIKNKDSYIYQLYNRMKKRGMTDDEIIDMIGEDNTEADVEDRTLGHEAEESDDEEREEHGQQGEEPMAEINTEKRPLKWSEIEAAMSKRESVEETVSEDSIPMSEMLIQKRPITWNDIERSIFKKNTPKIKNDAEEEVIKVANGLTSDPEGQKAYSADKKIKPMAKAANTVAPKGEPSANALTTKTGVKVSNPKDKQIKSQGEPTKQANLSGKKDAGSKAYTSKPGVKVSNPTDKQIKPIKK